jgi:hypothetical protein
MNTQGLSTPLERHGGWLLPFEGRFAVAGSVWLIATNAPEILAAARETFQPAEGAGRPIALKVCCFVDSELCAEKPWPQPHFRGLDHFVYAAYGAGASMLIDLRQRRVIGMFSPAMARDLSYWKCVLLPVLLGVTSASLGITPLHCACLVRDTQGLILGGAAGAGKSTLAVTLALNNFAFLSDDWTYFSRSGSATRAWGLPTPVKLLPDAIKYFPQLTEAQTSSSLNGELAYEVDPVAVFGVDRSLSCEPKWLVFVERTEGAGTFFKRISSRDAFRRFAGDLEELPDHFSNIRKQQLHTIRALVNRECWVLHHRLPPALVGEKLSEFCVPGRY